MTTMTDTPPAPAMMRRPLLSLPLILVFFANFGAMCSFYLLLSVVPMYATTIGIGGVGAGLATGALMCSTVVAELVTPALLARFGRRYVLAAGLVLLGAPALALPASSTMLGIMAVCVVRGVGFAIIVVTSSALVAELVPAERRGEGLGLSGVVSSVPAVVALPAGVWLANRFGCTPVFVLGAACALAGVVTAVCLPATPRTREKTATLGVRAGLRTPALAWPSLIFGATAMAAGIIATFLPMAVGASGDLAVLALLVQAAAATVFRWVAGRLGDRLGARRLLAPAVILSAAGILGLVLSGSPVAVLGGMLLFGTGFGIAQSASLAAMFDRVTPSGYSAVSAVWNMAYDAPYGLGSLAFGVVAVHTGYPPAFALTAALTMAALALVPRATRS
jgi:predicted MFS family arabinose efflux permease